MSDLPPSLPPSTVPARKAAFIRRQTRFLARPLRPSPAWTLENSSYEPSAGPTGSDPDLDPDRTPAPRARRQTKALSKPIPADVVARVFQQLNLRLKKHVTLSYPSIAVQHVSEQIDKLYWTAAAPVDQDIRLRALEFRERLRREDCAPRSDPTVEPAEDHHYRSDTDGDDSDTAANGLADEENIRFAPADPRYTTVINTRILPRTGDDFTKPSAFKTLPRSWDPQLDYDSTSISEHHKYAVREYPRLYDALRQLHDQREHLRLRTKAYVELASLLESIIGKVNPTTDERQSFPTQNIQPNILTRQSDLPNQMDACRALCLRLRARLADQ